MVSGQYCGLLGCSYHAFHTVMRFGTRAYSQINMFQEIIELKLRLFYIYYSKLHAIEMPALTTQASVTSSPVQT